eukprot:CAMPEP_0194238804 /NCGR_PEP_ID=MMETSP0158-20130606/5443_1 /TAXON_ID=33649 /ORGANISM="Thalassionema nitzschioides, Strain L26-B" /LENGTH=359 /DNA_ID=CAMNT_0038973137 /DNA_START=158 /DNA_END=1237 /DNA_ORIENTATION=-
MKLQTRALLFAALVAVAAAKQTSTAVDTKKSNPSSIKSANEMIQGSLPNYASLLFGSVERPESETAPIRTGLRKSSRRAQEGDDGEGGDGQEGDDGEGGDGQEGDDGEGGDGQEGDDGEGGDGQGGDGDGGDGEGGDGDGGDNNFGLCFSGLSVVKLEDGSTIRMRDLKIGDRVQVTENGKFDTVYAFGHYQPDSVAEYLRIQATTKAAPITISAPHMLFLDSRKAVPASSIKVDDILLGGNIVTKIDKVSMMGAYAPFTHSGSIVVNGVVASNYVSLTGRSTFLGMDMQLIAHNVVAARRALCQLNLCEEKYNDEGVATWIPYHTAARIAEQEFGIALFTIVVGGVIAFARRRQKIML